ncbi:hypothetical protein [Streptomyces xanthochromogenes]|uniref:hypothetical protein n=1 Tax=Streptomyces xanthochromogenes TaxID=67384 RepID=UPI003418740B
MPIQRYTAQEIVRKNVQRKASGMNREQVARETDAAESWERHAGREPGELGRLEPGRLESLRLARWKHTEWRRIGSLMTEEAMDVYTSTHDPAVQRWEEQRLKRVATETAAAEREGRRRVDVEENRIYRIVAERTSNTALGPPFITVHVTAQSAAQAALFAQQEYEGTGHRYRIIRVEEDLLGADGELEALRAFVQYAARAARAHSSARRRALEALGDAGNLCNATTIRVDTGEKIICTLEAGHYNPDVLPDRGRPGGWHLADSSMWTDDQAASTPHRTACS